MKDREIVVAVIIAYVTSCEYAQRLTGWGGRYETFKVAPHQTIHIRATCTVSIDLFWALIHLFSECAWSC